MAQCSRCHKNMGVFHKKYAGYSGERLCGACALSQQKTHFAERLDYMLKQVQAFPQHIEPLRDCAMEMRLGELLLQSKKPLSSGASREMAKVRSRFGQTSITELQRSRGDIVDRCGKLVEQLRKG